MIGSCRASCSGQTALEAQQPPRGKGSHDCSLHAGRCGRLAQERPLRVGPRVPAWSCPRRRARADWPAAKVHRGGPDAAVPPSLGPLLPAGGRVLGEVVKLPLELLPRGQLEIGVLAHLPLLVPLRIPARGEGNGGTGASQQQARVQAPPQRACATEPGERGEKGSGPANNALWRSDGGAGDGGSRPRPRSSAPRQHALRTHACSGSGGRCPRPRWQGPRGRTAWHTRTAGGRRRPGPAERRRPRSQ